MQAAVAALRPVTVSVERGDTILEAGDRVTGGTVNAAGGFVFRADKVGADSLLARIVHLSPRRSAAARRFKARWIKSPRSSSPPCSPSRSAHF
jgi:hypothetical protein